MSSSSKKRDAGSDLTENVVERRRKKCNGDEMETMKRQAERVGIAIRNNGYRLYPAALSEQEMDLYEDLLADHACWMLEVPGGVKAASDPLKGISRKKSSGKHNNATYLQVGGGDRGQKFMVHKLFALLNLEPPIPYSETADFTAMQASHLCHNHECVRKRHVHWEAQRYNVERNTGSGCPGWILNILPDRSANFYCCCTHEPRCLHVNVVRDPEVKHQGAPDFLNDDDDDK